MTELPDDMEERLEADLRYAETGRLAVTRTADLRALLLAYQERGRALEPFADCADTYQDFTPDEAFIDSTDGLTLAECRRARATLKGKSHE